MKVDPTIRWYAHKALQTAVRHHLYDRNVNLIDFGYPIHQGQIEENDFRIRVHVHEKMPPLQLEMAETAGQTVAVPEEIDGFKTDVIQATYRLNLCDGASSTFHNRTGRADPLRGGISISSERRNSAGTLGCLVRDRRTGEDLLLSNWHVIVGDWWARPGQHIYQPGRLDGGRATDTVALLDRDGMSVQLDAAVAKLNGSRRGLNDQVGLGPIRGVRRAEPGMLVMKSGRSSEITCGLVTAVDGTARLNYSSIMRMIRPTINIVPLEADDEVSRSGDSGSLWVTVDTHEAVGLHFAGSSDPEFGLALDLPTVLDLLGVDLLMEVEVETAAAAPRSLELARV